jgi:hypothetical protein
VSGCNDSATPDPVLISNTSAFRSRNGVLSWRAKLTGAPKGRHSPTTGIRGRSTSAHESQALRKRFKGTVPGGNAGIGAPAGRAQGACGARAGSHSIRTEALDLKRFPQSRCPIRSSPSQAPIRWRSRSAGPTSGVPAGAASASRFATAHMPALSSHPCASRLLKTERLSCAAASGPAPALSAIAREPPSRLHDPEPGPKTFTAHGALALSCHR